MCPERVAELLLRGVAMVDVQGVDLVAGGRNKSKHRTAPKSENVYLLLLVKVRRAPARCPPQIDPPAAACSRGQRRNRQ